MALRTFNQTPSTIQRRSGLISFKPAKREKSRSVEGMQHVFKHDYCPLSVHDQSPYGLVGTLVVFGNGRVLFARCDDYRLRALQPFSNYARGLFSGKGAANARWLVLMRRNAVIVCDVKQNRLGPDNLRFGAIVEMRRAQLHLHCKHRGAGSHL